MRGLVRQAGLVSLTSAPDTVCVVPVEDGAVLSGVRDVVAHPGQPLERVEGLEVTAQGRVHAGVVRARRSRGVARPAASGRALWRWRGDRGVQELKRKRWGSLGLSGIAFLGVLGATMAVALFAFHSYAGIVGNHVRFPS